MRDLPTPGPHQLAAVTKLVNTVSNNYGMSKKDLNLRWKVFNGIKNLFEQEFKGVKEII